MADAAPLIAFACIGRLELLPQVLGEVLVPEIVAAECLQPGLPGADAIATAFNNKLLTRHAGLADTALPIPQLDDGETAAINLAREIGASLLIDERLGRAVARRLGLVVIGSLGVLIAAKQRGLLPSVGGSIEQMRGNGYYISEALVREALRRASE